MRIFLIFIKKSSFAALVIDIIFRSTIEQLEAANETLARQLAAANETLARQLAAAKPAAEEGHSEASVAEVAGLQQRVSRVLFFMKWNNRPLQCLSVFIGITGQE